MEVAQRILATYSWSIIIVLLVFLWRVAFFYEKMSDQPVGSYFLLLPALLLAAGAVWYIMHGGSFVGEPAGDLLLFSGGCLLTLFDVRLQELMTGEQ